MVIINIVDKIRDIEPGKNTLIFLEDLTPFNLDIVVIGKKVENGISRKNVSYDDAWSYTLIDEKLISGENLAQPDDSDFTDNLEKAKKNYESYDLSTVFKLIKTSIDSPKYKKYEKTQSEYKERKKEYNSFRPSVIAEEIRKADLVVAEKKIAEKISKEMPKTTVAVLEHRVKGLKLQKKPCGTNYPRVFIKNAFSKEKEKPRIDRDTINTLFKQKADERSSYDILQLRLLDDYDNIDLSFYIDFNRDKENYTNPVSRTTFIVERPTRIAWSDYDNPSSIEVIVNAFGMSRKQGIYRCTANYFLKGIRKDKVDQIKGLYEKIWTKPLDSIEQIIDRQILVSKLVDDEQYLEKINELEKSLNKIFEPYIHLSSMSKLITANTLHSKWGGKLKKTPFYEDFTDTAEIFVEEYNRILNALTSLNPVSREMKVLIEPLKLMLKNNNLDKTYRFLKKIVDNKPKDFNDLHNIFRNELQRLKVSKVDELENYNPFKDSEVKFSKKRRETGDLGGYKSAYLEQLLKKFHRQNPVTKSEDIIGCFNYIGSKLTVYTLVALLVKKKKWTKAELTYDDGIVEIKNGWYPLTNLQHSDDFIKNPTNMNIDERVEVIDGPNITGKTIEMKKTLFIAATALTLGYVPAEYARISFFDKIAYRIKQTGMYYSGALAGDLTKVQEVLDQTNSSILVGLDELPGTSTNDLEGEALTYGLVKRLAEDKKVRAILTSHYPELQDILNDKSVSGVKFSHFEFEKKNGRLIFPHIKIDGPNKIGDYAVTIAKNQEINPLIIKHAEKYLKDLVEYKK